MLDKYFTDFDGCRASVLRFRIVAGKTFKPLRWLMGKYSDGKDGSWERMKANKMVAGQFF